MSWINKIAKLLGSFWSELYSDKTFILQVEKLYALYGKQAQGRQRAWFSGQILADTQNPRDYIPVVVYIRSITAAYNNID